jgi:hypothetical protein
MAAHVQNTASAAPPGAAPTAAAAASAAKAAPGTLWLQKLTCPRAGTAGGKARAGAVVRQRSLQRLRGWATVAAAAPSRTQRRSETATQPGASANRSHGLLFAIAHPFVGIMQHAWVRSGDACARSLRRREVSLSACQCVLSGAAPARSRPFAQPSRWTFSGTQFQLRLTHSETSVLGAATPQPARRMAGTCVLAWQRQGLQRSAAPSSAMRLWLCDELASSCTLYVILTVNIFVLLQQSAGALHQRERL